MTTVEGQTIRGSLPHLVEDVKYVGCVFDNCHQRAGVMRNVQFIDCAAWATSFSDVVFDECLFQNMKTRIPAQSPGKSMPLFFWGCFARHLTIKGAVGGFIWNPFLVKLGQIDFSRKTVSKADRFYKKVDWALDISEARFRSVPTFSFGPPGELVRRDVNRQPLVTREVAASVDWQSVQDKIGIWWVVMRDFQRQPWPAATVLIPALGGRRARVEEELAGITYLREAGLTVD